MGIASDISDDLDDLDSSSSSSSSGGGSDDDDGGGGIATSVTEDVERLSGGSDDDDNGGSSGGGGGGESGPGYIPGAPGSPDADSGGSSSGGGGGGSGGSGGTGGSSIPDRSDDPNPFTPRDESGTTDTPTRSDDPNPFTPRDEGDVTDPTIRRSPPEQSGGPPQRTPDDDPIAAPSSQGIEETGGDDEVFLFNSDTGQRRFEGEREAAAYLESQFLAENPQFTERDVRVTRDGGSFGLELTAQGEAQQVIESVRYYEQQLEQQTGRDVEPGRDFTVSEPSDGRLQATTTEAFTEDIRQEQQLEAEQRAASQLEAQVGRQIAQTIGISPGVLDDETLRSIAGLERGRDYTVTSEYGQISASLTPETEESLQRELAATAYETQLGSDGPMVSIDPESDIVLTGDGPELTESARGRVETRFLSSTVEDIERFLGTGDLTGGPVAPERGDTDRLSATYELAPGISTEPYLDATGDFFGGLQEWVNKDYAGVLEETFVEPLDNPNRRPLGFVPSARETKSYAVGALGGVLTLAQTGAELPARALNLSAAADEVIYESEDPQAAAEFTDQLSTQAQRLPAVALSGLIGTFAENPARATGALAGSLAGSGVAMRALPASRWAIQPGEEVLGRGGFAATRRVAGERTAQRLFPNKEPLIFSEEAAIRGVRRAGQAAGRAGQRIRTEVRADLLEGGTDRGQLQMGQELDRPAEPEESDLGPDLDPFDVSDTRLYDPARTFGETEPIERFIDERTGELPQDIGTGIGPRGEAGGFRGGTVEENFRAYLEEEQARAEMAQETFMQLEARRRAEVAAVLSGQEVDGVGIETPALERLGVDVGVESRQGSEPFTDLFADLDFDAEQRTGFESEAEGESAYDLELEAEAEAEFFREFESEFEQEQEQELEAEIPDREERDRDTSAETMTEGPAGRSVIGRAFAPGWLNQFVVAQAGGGLAARQAPENIEEIAEERGTFLGLPTEGQVNPDEDLAAGLEAVEELFFVGGGGGADTAESPVEAGDDESLPLLDVSGGESETADEDPWGLGL